MEERLGQSIPPHDHEDEVAVLEYEHSEEKQKRFQELSGEKNYQGDWTLLFRERVLNKDTKNKFIDSKILNETEEKHASQYFESSEKFNLKKPSDVPIDHYVGSQTGYDKNIESVFSSTKYDNAIEFSKSPNKLGVSAGYGDTAAVFKDAVHGEVNFKLNNRQKNIVEAHEKAHSIFARLTNAEKQRIMDVFDPLAFNYGLKVQPDEYLARMSQLKNYFGFKGNEVFTLTHLEYAMENYIEETGLDNNMREFFNAIKDPYKFVDLMNTIAC